MDVDKKYMVAGAAVAVGAAALYLMTRSAQEPAKAENPTKKSEAEPAKAPAPSKKAEAPAKKAEVEPAKKAEAEPAKKEEAEPAKTEEGEPASKAEADPVKEPEAEPQPVKEAAPVEEAESEPVAETGSTPAAGSEIMKLLDGKLLNGDGEEIAASSLGGKPFGIYFSAHWCGPCRMFTPALAATYQKIKEKGQDFEVVFITADRDQESFDNYFKEMPWLALPYADERIQKIHQHLEVRGYPTFIMFNADGSVSNANARANVQNDPEGADFPWAPAVPASPENPVAPVEAISVSPPALAMIALCEGASAAEQDAAVKAMAPSAIAQFADGEPRVRFYVARTTSGDAQRIRAGLGLGPASTSIPLVLLDIVEKKYYQMDDEGASQITPEMVNNLVEFQPFLDSRVFMA